MRLRTAVTHVPLFHILGGKVTFFSPLVTVRLNMLHQPGLKKA